MPASTPRRIVPATDYLPIGQGYGPAEINLAFLFDIPPVSTSTAACRMVGRMLYGETTGSFVEGRYGEGYLTGSRLPHARFIPPTA